ncbi:MAG: hypothetical protein IKT73_07695 [Anaerotignum sp.]|nr:hypothetical protein [Anaerotignum sp.]
MKKGFVMLCIIMSVVCMMLSALALALKKQGMAEVVFLSSMMDPKYAALILMILAVAFLYLALRVVMKLKKR